MLGCGVEVTACRVRVAACTGSLGVELKSLLVGLESLGCNGSLIAELESLFLQSRNHSVTELESFGCELRIAACIVRFACFEELESLGRGARMIACRLESFVCRVGFVDVMSFVMRQLDGVGVIKLKLEAKVISQAREH